MSSETTNLGLLKKDPATDGADTFNIETMLNENWDKIDAVTGPASASSPGVVTIGSGIDVDINGVISVPGVDVPVTSVNGETGAVTLSPADVGAATVAQGTTADNTAAALAIHQADYAQDTGAANAYAITLSPAPEAYSIGKIYKFKAANVNTGASTFAIGALTATAIKKNVSVALAAGDIPAGVIIPVMYDGTYFQLIPMNPILPSIFTAQADIMYATGANVPARLAKGTASQLLAMNAGATAPEWKTVSLSDGAWEKITEITLVSTVTQVDFASLGLENYKDLKILFNAQTSNVVVADISLKLNNQTTGYNYSIIQSNTGITCWGQEAFSKYPLTKASGSNDSNYGPSYGEINISNYPTTRRKYLMSNHVGRDGNGVLTQFRVSGSVSLLTAIDTISLVIDSYAFDIGSRFVLWGVK